MNKKITLDPTTIDGNAFSIIGAFSRQAKKEGWTQEEITEVLDEAQSGDYDNLLRVIIKHCE